MSDWVSVDFCYYAILVEILRTRLRYAPSPLTHRECLSYARCSLKAFQYLQEHVVNELDFAPYPFFLTWFAFPPPAIGPQTNRDNQDYVHVPSQPILRPYLQHHRNPR